MEGWETVKNTQFPTEVPSVWQAGGLGDCKEHAVSLLPRYHQCGARGRLGDYEEHSVSFLLRYHQYGGGKRGLGQEFAH